MASDLPTYIPFSQRDGIDPIPPQLKLGELSSELRRLIDYAITEEIGRYSVGSYNGVYLTNEGEIVCKDLHVRFFKRQIGSFSDKATDWKTKLTNFVASQSIGPLFDLVEFFVRHGSCSKFLKRDLAEAFETSRSAYRVIDHSYVAAIGTEEQAQAYQKALFEAQARGASVARTHLIAAGVSLRVGDWPGSVRESIHAVESMALKLAPGANSLAPALTELSKQGHLHGALKSAFSALYGYSSDQEGVRHARVFDDETKVDETDALFMLGACASFVSYLVARMQKAE